jgi:hypothetical protein
MATLRQGHSKGQHSPIPAGCLLLPFIQGMDERFLQPGKKPMLQILVGGVQLHLHCFPSQQVHTPALAGKNENNQHNNPKDLFYK